MNKRTKAENFSKISADETGILMNITFVCPYCHYETGGLILTGPNCNVDSDFETDQTCDICGKNVIVECRHQNTAS